MALAVVIGVGVWVLAFGQLLAFGASWLSALLRSAAIADVVILMVLATCHQRED